MSTISGWPWATRRRISASTADARRLRVPPRTSGMTQNAHENEHPSWIFTNARRRSRRAEASTHAIAPTSPATAAGVSSLGRATTVTFGATRAKAPSRFAPQPVTKTLSCVRAARETAWRDFETASFVTQQVFTTAMSATPSASTWPSASSRSRTACASANETLQPRNRVWNEAIGGSA